MNKRKHDQKRKEERKESFYRSVKEYAFKSGDLHKSDLKKLPAERKREYIENRLRIISGRIVSYTCEKCALRIVYHENGEVTDEELIPLLDL